MTNWNFACPDWRDRLAARRSLVPPLPLDETEARRAVAIFNRLRLPDVIGQPTLGEAAGDWFRDVVRALFGSLDPRTGLRHVPGVFVLVPKKNSKSTSSAALMITALLMNRRPNAPFALFGPTQEIADIAYDAAAGMIEADADLKRLFHTQDHLKRITHRITDAQLKVTTFDPSVATGGKYAGWLLDELHLLGKTVYAARVLGQLRGARTAVPESFGVIITTQSDEPPAGVFKAELQYARDVRDGRAENPTVLPVLYEFPEEMQTDRDKPWREARHWPLVLPNLGRSVNLEVLRQDFATAVQKGEEELRRWASQHLNIEIGLALQSDRWPGADHWEAASLPGLTLEALIARSDVCTIGIDGGGLDDLTAVCVLGRCAETGRWIAWAKALADVGVLALRKDIAPRLLDLAASGDLAIYDMAGDAAPEQAAHLSPPPEFAAGDPLASLPADVATVAAICRQVFEAGKLPEKAGIGVDAVGIAAIGDAIEAAGVPAESIAAVPQGFRLSGVIKGAARKLKDGTLVHAGQPLMSFAVGNARQEARGNAVLITKQVSGSAKIDPLIALFNAFDLMSRNPASSGLHFWETA